MNRGTISVVAAVSSWVVIICGGAFSFFQFIYPELKEASRIQSENNYLKEQIIQLKEDKRSIHTSLNELISSSSSQSIEAFQAKERIAQCSVQLAQANERITSLTDQANRLGAVVETSKRCAPFVEQINELQKEMAGRTFEAMGKPPSAERRAELGSLIAQQQVTLQTCLSMKQ